MSKAILFDLDGTLLPMDTKQFIKDYMAVLAPRVSEYVAPEHFLKSLWEATSAVIADLDPQKTNEQVFEEAFLQAVQVEKETLWPILDDFYERVFPTLSYLSEPTPLAGKICEEAIAQGYELAVATNPIFPKAAIEQRLHWAGVGHIPFAVVTVYEEWCFTKPHRQYYESICRRMNVSPEQCVMVGNDVQEDMAASLIGMKTYLVEGYVIDRGEPQYPIDDRGTLEDLYADLKQGRGLFSMKKDG